MSASINKLMSLNTTQFIEYSLKYNLNTNTVANILNIKEYISYYPGLKDLVSGIINLKLSYSDKIDSIYYLIQILKLSFELNSALKFTMESEYYFKSLGYSSLSETFYNYIIDNIIYDNEKYK